MSSRKVYWVIRGRVPGLYHDWDSCLAQVHKFSGASYRSYKSESEYLQAKATLERLESSSSSSSSSSNTMDNETSRLEGKVESTIVYTDGSCQTVNGARLGGIGVWFGHGDDRNVSAGLPGELQTNQRAEQYAVLVAMKQHILHGEPSQLRIISDSMYTVLGMNDYSKSWEASNQWHKVKNVDLWKQLLETRAKLKRGLVIEHVFGHKGNEGNEAADQLATAYVAGRRKVRHHKAGKHQDD